MAMQKEVCELRREGKTIEEIMEATKYARNTVLNYLRREGLGSGGGGQNRLLSHLVFDNVDDVDTQYWVGYLAADGNIYCKDNRRSIHVVSIDKEHLENYISWLKAPLT